MQDEVKGRTSRFPVRGRFADGCVASSQESGLFPGSSGHHADGKRGAAEEEQQPEPPASVLTRRRALVPPKIPPYNMDSSEDAEQSVDKETSTR